MLSFILLAFLIAAFQLIGGILSWLFPKLMKNNKRYALLAQMFLMIIIISELIKEGFAVTALIIISFCAGFLALYLVDKKRKQSMLFSSSLLHNMPEGIAIGASYLIDPSLGIAIGILLAIHNLPEGIITALPFIEKSKIKIAFKTLFTTQAIFLISGILSYIALSMAEQVVQIHAITLSAGMMLYTIIKEGVIIG